MIALATSLESLIREELAGEFRIGAPLPEGAFGQRFRAEDLSRGEVVDLVVLGPMGDGDAGAAARFLETLKSASLLDHPHLNPICAYGVTGPLRWYAIPASSDRTLHEEIAAGGALPLATVKRIAQQIASALDQAHRRGLIHGALSADDVMLAPDGWVRVQGVGIAGAVDGDGSAPFARLVTPSQGPDQAALAAIISESLSGGTDAPLPADLSPILDPVLRRATRERPSERYRDLLDLVGALDGSASAGRQLQPSLPIGDLGRSEDWKELLAEEFTTRPAPRLPLPRLPSLLTIVATIGLAFAVGPWLGEDPGAPVVETARAAAATPSIPVESAPPPVVERAPVAPVVSRSAPPKRVVRTPPPQRVTSSPATHAPAPTVQTVVVAPPPALAPPVPGSLFVNATPWGEVLIDGHPMGNTPLIGLAIAPGSHRLQVRRDGYVTYFVTIDVAPGAELRLTEITLRELAP